ncbi:hypothetical protein BJ165DRAFT_1409942 [Panaeolus papilionaceus]|nr:hypothetical protein BJ165DRAFT_1409942 [Panaeolus papilionaceus]
MKYPSYIAIICTALVSLAPLGHASPTINDAQSGHAPNVDCFGVQVFQLSLYLFYSPHKSLVAFLSDFATEPEGYEVSFTDKTFPSRERWYNPTIEYEATQVNETLPPSKFPFYAPKYLLRFKPYLDFNTGYGLHATAESGYMRVVHAGEDEGGSQSDIGMVFGVETLNGRVNGGLWSIRRDVEQVPPLLQPWPYQVERRELMWRQVSNFEPYAGGLRWLKGWIRIAEGGLRRHLWVAS